LPADHVAVLGPVPQSAALLADAFVSDDFVRAFVRLMWADGNASPASGALRGRHTERAPVDSVEGPIRRGTAEQSNTSMRIGDRLILKVLRRLEWGIHPELEMGRFLTEEAHFKATPALIGWIDLDGSTLAILMAFVPNDGDGWSWVLERLRAGERERALTWIRRLGEVTAELHLALAISTGDPAFEPAPVTDADWEQWSGAALGMAADVRESLRANRAALDGVTRALADGFERSADRLSHQLRLHPLRSVVAKTRHHGDYHLGQILVQGEDAVIVDFEGEPLRPLSARRAKHLPLRDVAGMLRSFSYVGQSAVRKFAHNDAEAARLAPLARAWELEVRAAFLAAYIEASQSLASVVPGEGLLGLFEIEKAFYEVRYEIGNRPGWTGIPLQGILEWSSPDAKH
jgi:maltose alpha-D-glucosyltransferase/alpha-amylase